MQKAGSVEEYIRGANPQMRPGLKLLRGIIKKLVPKALEGISYGMPFYDYHGRLVYFACQKDYIGLYIPPPIIDQHKKFLQGYVTTKSAVHLPYTKLPVGIIKKLINARINYNRLKSKSKT